MSCLKANRMNFTEKAIELARIDLEDFSYKITTSTEIKDLVDSIRKTGLINPPILKEKGSKFIIISGFRRIFALKEIGFSHIESRIIDSREKSLRCIELAVADNASQRRLNPVEQSRALNCLSNILEDKLNLEKEALSLGLPWNSHFIKRIKKLSFLPEFIQQCMLNNTITMTIALKLNDLEADAGTELAKLFNDLKLSSSKQREIITLVKEISIREDILFSDVLGSNIIIDMLTDPDMDRTQKTGKIRSYLKERRFPSITKANKEVEESIKKLNLGGGIKMTPPRDFEGETFNLSFDFKSLSELKKQKKSLGRILQNFELLKILSM